MGESRTAQVERKTGETSIELGISLDGSGQATVDTGVGFLDHMLELFARHGQFDLEVEATGDVNVDDHHTTEDVGIVLGQATCQALGNKKGINRFASICLPMQESLARIAVDISGRSFVQCNVPFPTDKIGTFDSELVEEFLYGFGQNAGITLHVDLIRGNNSHHIAEAVFKGLARAVGSAVRRNEHMGEQIPSTKGTL